MGACEGDRVGAVEGAVVGVREGARVGALVGRGGLVGDRVGEGVGGLDGAHCCKMRGKRSMCPSLRRRSSFDNASRARRVLVAVVGVSLRWRSRTMRKQFSVSYSLILSPFSHTNPTMFGSTMGSAVVVAA